MSRGKRLTREEFITKSNNIFLNKYDYSHVNYANNYTKVKIICNVHGIFEQRPNAHLSGAGCLECSRIDKRLNHQNFVNKANIIHKFKYQYPQKYIKSNLRIEITCPFHGSFFQTPNSHLNGKGCKKCATEYTTGILKKSNEQFINEANIVHNSYYKYLDNYNGHSIKIEISCPRHGMFLQAPQHHLEGAGCPNCTGCGQKTHKQFLLAATETHGNKYKYLSKYINCKIPLKIHCDKHGTFQQTPDAHLNGRQGCPTCGKIISKMESDWLDYIKIPNDSNHRQVKLKINNKYLKVDGFDPITNTVYEFYGDFWHGNLKVYKDNDINNFNNKRFIELNKSTFDREILIKSVGYNLISIWESDWKKINETAKL